MRNKVKIFFWSSLIGLSIFFLVFFSLFLVAMNRLTDRTVEYTGSVYMWGLNEAITRHFETIVAENVSSLRSIARIGHLNDDKTPEEIRTGLVEEAQRQGFTYLAIATKDEQLEMILGEPLTLESHKAFFSAIEKDEQKVSIATTPSGEKAYVVGVRVEYTTDDGKEFIALIGGRNSDFLANQFALTDDGVRLTTSSIFNSRGTFAARATQDEYDNHFTRFQNEVVKTSRGTIKEYLLELQQAMYRQENFNAIVELKSGESVHLFYSPLPDSEWYLVTGLPYHTMERGIEKIGRDRLYIIVTGYICIILVMLFVYFVIIRLFREQFARMEQSEASARRANQAKTEFLSNMSHDIRTPMNAIVGLTKVAKDNLSDPQKVDDCLDKMLISSRHLLNLISDVLDMSKIESGKMTLNIEEFSLPELVKGVATVIEPQSRNRGQAFCCYTEQIKTERIYGDRMRLGQIMLNLLSNAVKFTQEQGIVIFHIYEESSPLGDDYVRLGIRVKDNGIGIEEEFLKKLFDPFVREDAKRVKKTQGSGLGMAITKRLTDMMEGSIEVTSKVGTGTEFLVLLDLKKGEEQQPEGLKDTRVLVVDEEQVCGEVLLSTFELLSAEPVLLTVPGQVIEEWKKSDEQNRPYDLIAWNWNTATNVSKEALHALYEAFGELPLLIFVNDWFSCKQEAEALGVKGYVTNPVFPSDLCESVQKYLRGEPEEPKWKEEERIRFSSLRMLVAEDNDINWEILDMLFTKQGIHMDRAENGRECVEMLTSSEPGTYQVVLMDIRMPEMDGYEATKAIRSAEHPDSQIPIIAMTADSFEEDIRRALDSGMNAHVAKPIDTDHLLKVILEIVEK